jgi:FKBP-type peptidyl-prolyl cis-trans isomerase
MRRATGLLTGMAMLLAAAPALAQPAAALVQSGAVPASAAPAPAPAAPANSGDPLSFDANMKFLALYAAKPGVTTLPDGLMYKVIEPGDGKGVSPIGRNDIVWVEYRGWLLNGQDFDRTKPNEPKNFVLGNLIKGWSEALMKMKTGQEFQIVIPAKLGYGDKGRAPVIPPDQTLIFLVKLTKVEYP